MIRRRRWRLLLALTLLLPVGGLALVPGVRWPVVGWLRGEAFYRGMPTSWWAAEIRENYRHMQALSFVVCLTNPGAGVANEASAPSVDLTHWRHETPVPLVDRLREWLGIGNPVTSIGAVIVKLWTDAPLVDGDATALPVLLELLRNGDAKVRWLAVSGLAALKPTPPEIVPALVGAVDDEDANVRTEARMALRRIDAAAADKAGVK